MSAEALTGLSPQTLKVLAEGRTTHFRGWVKNARAEEISMNQLALNPDVDPELRIKASAQAVKLRDQLFEAVGLPTRPKAELKAPDAQRVLDATPVD